MVAFHADFDNYTENNYNISDGGIINFDNILINEGDGYDNTTGYFTAPVAGNLQDTRCYNKQLFYCGLLGGLTVCSTHGEFCGTVVLLPSGVA